MTALGARAVPDAAASGDGGRANGRGGPLAGYRVLDFATALAGPWLAGILGDQGAEVIKIEQPGSGDVYRSSGTLHHGFSAMFHLANRGKRSITVDLRRPEGQAVAADLAAGADVVVQNYRPGVAERLGVGYETLRARQPELVFVAVSGFGPHGPYRDRPAFDSVVQAASGMCAAEAAGGGRPRLVEQTLADKLTAVMGAQAAVAALLARRDGRGGQRLDVPMLDVSAAFMWMDCAGRETLVDAPPDVPSTVAGSRRLIRSADGWFVLGIGSDRSFAGVCDAFSLDPGRYEPLQTAAGRATHRDVMAAFMADLEVAAATVPVDEVRRRMLDRDVPFGAVAGVADVPSDPQVVASGLFTETRHPVAGRIRQPRPPVRFSSTLPEDPGDSPGLGEHTDQILAELGGYDVADLHRRGIVG